MINKYLILKSFLVTETSCDDIIYLRKFSTNILELVFGRVLDTIQEIQVRSYSVGKEINKSLHFQGTFDIKYPKFIFRNDHKHCQRISLKLLRGFSSSSQCVITSTFSHQKLTSKFGPFFIISEFFLLVMNLLNSRDTYPNLNVEFLYTSLCHCTIHFYQDVI